MTNTFQLRKKPELPLLAIFGLGYGSSLLMPAPNMTSVSSILLNLTKPEVFVPVFLAAFLIVSMFVLGESRRQEALTSEAAKRRAKIALRGDSETGDAEIGGANPVVAQMLARTRDELEQQVHGAFSTVGEFIVKNGKYAKKLDDARSELGAELTLEQIRAVAEMLVRENAVASEETKLLRSSLDQARTRIAEMKDRLEAAKLEAFTDPLTGVGNRRSFDQCLEAEVRRSHAEHTPLCLIMADIDHFKRVNDTFGHQAGDDVLEQVASILKGSVRTTDFVAHYGGEEFSVLLPRTTTGNALGIAERIRTTLAAKPIFSNGQPIGRITASFGVAAVQSNELPSDLVGRADKKVYEAKLKGRNRVEIDSASSA